MDEPPEISDVARVASHAGRLGARDVEERSWTSDLLDLAQDQRWALGFIGVALVALMVRALFVLPAGFPLNDGGLFVVMSQDIQAAGYALPWTTSYNPAGYEAAIPFAYPPLAFYIAALIEDLTPFSMLEVYWLLPLTGSMLTVAGVYCLGRTFFEGRLIPLLAAFAFALTPRSFTWLVMGGGLTRSLGLAAALFALAAFRIAMREDAAPATRRRALVAATLLSAATLGTHLEAAVLLATGILLSSVLPPTRWRVTVFLTVGLGTLTLTAPWWATVLVRHGFEPFLAARTYGGDVLSDGVISSNLFERLITPVITHEPFFAVVGATGALGAFIAVARGHWVLPALWGALILLNMRALATFSVVPTALLAGYATAQVLIPILRDAATGEGDDPAASPDVTSDATARRPRSEFASWRPALLAGLVLGILFYGATHQSRGEAAYLRPVSDVDQRAMSWAALALPPDSTFLVIPMRPWPADREGEWLPTLAHRPAVNVPQGYEWVDGAFDRRVYLHDLAWTCWYQDADCIEAIAQQVEFTHVFLPNGCCDPLLMSFISDPRYDVEYLAGAAIVRRGLSSQWR
ncbi:MAG: hypothetical protein M0R73_10085 [Dehalococcoidia bacterium]|nr:hypothetical protein [Dehalococcoidia bacterium]